MKQIQNTNTKNKQIQNTNTKIHSVQMTEIQGGRHMIDDTELVLLQVKQIQNTNTYKNTQIHTNTKIHSVQMTEIEGGRHRIDDTQFMSWRKTKYKYNTTHRYKDSRCAYDNTLPQCTSGRQAQSRLSSPEHQSIRFHALKYLTIRKWCLLLEKSCAVCFITFVEVCSSKYLLVLVGFKTN